MRQIEERGSLTRSAVAGFMGGTSSSDHGSGANLLCLPDNPVFDNLKRTSCGPSTIYGAEYEVCPDPHHDMDIVCALCRSVRLAFACLSLPVCLYVCLCFPRKRVLWTQKLGSFFSPPRIQSIQGLSLKPEVFRIYVFMSSCCQDYCLLVLKIFMQAKFCSCKKEKKKRKKKEAFLLLQMLFCCCKTRFLYLQRKSC